MTSILQLIYFHEKKSKKLEKEEMLSFRFYEVGSSPFLPLVVHTLVNSRINLSFGFFLIHESITNNTLVTSVDLYR